jgi:NADP-dependent 3-hydroxy acid dehydrogenase YdfG
VNDAGLAIYGRLDEVSERDSHKLFDVNFWGLVNGSLAALPHLKKNGGALINLGSEVSESAVPPSRHVCGLETHGQGLERRPSDRDRGRGQGPGVRSR